MPRVMRRIFFALILVALTVSRAAAVELDERPSLRLVLNLPAYSLYLYEGNELIRSYRVAIGTPEHPTPIGSFRIVSKIKDPGWYPPGGPSVPPGPDNPLGGFWMGIDGDEYGIHGTISPSSIGNAVSLGCVRMYPEDIAELFDLIPKGTPIDIVYNTIVLRNDEGRPVLTVFRDIYRRGTNTPDALKRALLEGGFGSAWSDEEIEAILARAEAEGVAEIRSRRQGLWVTINGDPVPVDVKVLDGLKLLRLRDLVRELGGQLYWNPRDNRVYVNGLLAHGRRIESRMYVGPEEVARLFNVEVAGDEHGNVYIQYFTVYVDGNFFTRDVRFREGRPYLPLAPLVVATAAPVRWDLTEGALYVGHRRLDDVLFRGRIYVPLDSVAEYFDLTVEFDPATLSIHLWR